MLDQFSEAKATQQQQQQKSEPAEASISSGPGRPSATTSALPPDLPVPHGPAADESEEAFMARLTAEMSTVMSKFSADPAANADATPEDIAKMGRELEEFTQKMEAQGIQPEDLLKAILGEDVGGQVGDIAHEEHDRRESESKSRAKSASKKTKSQSPETSRATTTDEARPTSGSSSTSKPQQPTSFEDTIRRTMARMDESSAAATTASTKQQQKSEEDMLADMLRALESQGGADGDGDGDMSKMFLGMMEQLTNKEMLFEPMKELSEKFPAWLKENDPFSASTSTAASKKKQSPPKLSQPDFERFTRQEQIVQDIVGKFEEKGYSDEDPKCREFIWEKMQEMQAEGAPPEDLIANPFPGMGGMGGLLGGGGEGEEGCPTQ